MKGAFSGVVDVVFVWVGAVVEVVLDGAGVNVTVIVFVSLGLQIKN